MKTPLPRFSARPGTGFSHRRFTSCLLAAVLAFSLLWIPGLAHPGEERIFPGPDEDHQVALDIRIREGLVYMDVRDADLRQILEDLCMMAGVELTLGSGLRGTVTAEFTGIPLEEALERICGNRALVFDFLPDEKAFKVTALRAYAGGPEEGRVPERQSPGRAQEAEEAAVRHEKDSGRKTEGPAPRPATDSRGRPLYKQGEILIKLKKGVSREALSRLHQALGTRVLGRLERLRLVRLALPPGLSEEEAVSAYEASGLVEYAEKHALRYPQSTPNDPYFPDQWALPRIQAPAAWDVALGRPEIIIAVIDTGVGLDHLDLAENIWVNTPELNGNPGEDDDGNGYIDDTHGWDFGGDSYGNQDNDPTDLNGHGTHVAGIIGARGGNGIGIAGVCWDISIMALKVQADDSGTMEDFAIIEALDYAAENGARVVNCSFGGELYTDSEYEAFQYLQSRGVLAVCAAGNDGYDLDDPNYANYPASYDLENIISVAASDKDDSLTDISNYGAESVDLAAPGYSIYSTIPGLAYTEASVKATLDSDTTTYPAAGLEYAGITDSQGITATAYYCGLGGHPSDFPEEVEGGIALIQRGGDIYFSEKAANAQDAGALAAVIYNHEKGDYDSWTLQDPDDWIPVVGISRENGEELKALAPLTLTITNKLSDDPAYYGTKQGTSMAAPHVSGLAGLLLSAAPDLQYDELKSAILNGVDQVPDLEEKMVSGGRANALRSLCVLGMAPADVCCTTTDPGLEHAIAALQTLTGLTPDLSTDFGLPCPLDPDQDGSTTLLDIILLLQTLSGPRE